MAAAFAEYVAITQGSCESNGGGSLRSAKDCVNAAEALGLSDLTADSISSVKKPRFCSFSTAYFNRDLIETLSFNSLEETTEVCSEGETCLCRAVASCVNDPYEPLWHHQQRLKLGSCTSPIAACNLFAQLPSFTCQDLQSIRASDQLIKAPLPPSPPPTNASWGSLIGAYGDGRWTTLCNSRLAGWHYWLKEGPYACNATCTDAEHNGNELTQFHTALPIKQICPTECALAFLAEGATNNFCALSAPPSPPLPFVPPPAVPNTSPPPPSAPPRLEWDTPPEQMVGYTLGALLAVCLCGCATVKYREKTAKKRKAAAAAKSCRRFLNSAESEYEQTRKRQASQRRLPLPLAYCIAPQPASKPVCIPQPEQPTAPTVARGGSGRLAGSKASSAAMEEADPVVDAVEMQRLAVRDTKERRKFLRQSSLESVIALAHRESRHTAHHSADGADDGQSASVGATTATDGSAVDGTATALVLTDHATDTRSNGSPFGARPHLPRLDVQLSRQLSADSAACRADGRRETSTASSNKKLATRPSLAKPNTAIDSMMESWRHLWTESDSESDRSGQTARDIARARAVGGATGAATGGATKDDDNELSFSLTSFAFPWQRSPQNSSRATTLRESGAPQPRHERCGGMLQSIAEKALRADYPVWDKRSKQSTAAKSRSSSGQQQRPTYSDPGGAALAAAPVPPPRVRRAGLIA